MPPLYIRDGGSVPVCASFESILGLSTVLLGFAPADGQFHAPNEWMWMSNFETGYQDHCAILGRGVQVGPSKTLARNVATGRSRGPGRWWSRSTVWMGIRGRGALVG